MKTPLVLAKVLGPAFPTIIVVHSLRWIVNFH
jgi:hypothetical protein